MVAGHRILARLTGARPELLLGDRVDEEADIGLGAAAARHAEVALAQLGDEGLELLGALDGVLERFECELDHCDLRSSSLASIRFKRLGKWLRVVLVCYRPPCHPLVSPAAVLLSFALPAPTGSGPYLLSRRPVSGLVSVRSRTLSPEPLAEPFKDLIN